MFGRYVPNYRAASGHRLLANVIQWHPMPLGTQQSGPIPDHAENRISFASGGAERFGWGPGPFPWNLSRVASNDNSMTFSEQLLLSHLNVSAGTIVCWCKPTFAADDSSRRFLWGANGGAVGGVGFQRFTDNTWYVGWLTGSGDHRVVVADSATNLLQNDWNFYGFTWNGTTGSVLYHGTRTLAPASIGTNATATVTATGTQEMAWGNFDRGGSLGIGAGSGIADMAVFLRTFTAEEMVAWWDQSRRGHPDTLARFSHRAKMAHLPVVEAPVTARPPWLGRPPFGQLSVTRFPSLNPFHAVTAAATADLAPVTERPPWFGRSLFGQFGIGTGFPSLASTFVTFAGGGVTPPVFVPPPGAFRPLFDQIGFLKGLWPRVSVSPVDSVPNPPPPPPPPVPPDYGTPNRRKAVLVPRVTYGAGGINLNKLRAHTEVVELILNSLMRKGRISQLAQTDDFEIVAGGFVNDRDPDVDDDQTQGAFAGVTWTNRTDQTMWVCMDATEGAAVWRQLTLI